MAKVSFLGLLHDRMMWVQPQSGRIVACVDKTLYDEIILAWWLPTNSKFSEQEFEEIRMNNEWIVGNS